MESLFLLCLKVLLVKETFFFFSDDYTLMLDLRTLAGFFNVSLKTAFQKGWFIVKQKTLHSKRKLNLIRANSSTSVLMLLNV